jgi:mono/diheme cytochrome c family protein
VTAMKRFFTCLALLAGLALPVAVVHADNAGPQNGTSSAAQAKAGATIYANICQGCHMENALGATGAATIPALAGNSHLGAPAYPIFVVLYGRGAMPALGGLLSDTQVANVLNYVRQNFGNHFSNPISPSEVGKVRIPGRLYAGGF